MDETVMAADEAVARGDHERARSLLEEVARESPSISVWVKLATLRRASGDLPAALAAIDAALVLDPLDPTALLLRGVILDKLGRAVDAADAYDAALAQRVDDPPEPPAINAMLVRARSVRDDRREALETAMRDVIVEPLSAGEHRRLARFIGNTTRRTRASVQAPTHFAYPGLAVDEFHDRALFPWLASVEAATDAITAELVAVLDEATLSSPYIAYRPGRPLGQWAALNNSRAWSAIHLLEGGAPTRAAALCQKTMALLATVPQPVLPNRSPAAMFSRLAPHTRIPPHTGVGNMRLVCHLPLIVPPGCGFRVGDEIREWVRGEAWVFDDTIEHEAWNDSDEERTILIFDVWHPGLSAVERSTLGDLFATLDAGYGATSL